MNDDLPTKRVEHDASQTVRLPPPAREVVFQRYELLRKLAAGGMGEVWLARDNVQGTEAALKFLKEDFAADLQAVNELKQEVLNSLKLNHQNILRVYRFEVDEAAQLLTRRYAISMEYIRGMNLRDLRRDKKVDYFDVAEARDWVLQMCDAIHYAHERKLVHRDIKPANLMIDENKAIKVCDFGIGRTVAETSSGRTQNNAGTIPYMSRQQREFYKASPQDDIYAIGATIYDLLSGHPPRYKGRQVILPFDEKPPRMAAWRKRTESKGSGLEIPAEWERVVELCLSENPSTRPATARAVREMLEGRAPVVMADPSKGGSPGSGAWKKIVLALTAALALAAAGGYYYWGNYLRVLPEVEQLIATGRISSEEGKKLNNVLRGPDGYERQLAARLSARTLDSAAWRDFSTLVSPKSENQAKLRPLLAQKAIKEEEFYILAKDLDGKEDSPLKVLAKQLVLERTINAGEWRDARVKIVDPLLEKINLLISTGAITSQEGDTLKADHARTDGSKEAALAHRLLEERSLDVAQWRKERFPESSLPPIVRKPPEEEKDPILKLLEPLVRGGIVTVPEAAWLHGILSGQNNDAEKTLAQRLLSREITPGIWRARTAYDYRLKDGAVLDPGNLPPAIDLLLNDSTVVRLLRMESGSFIRGSARDELGRRPNEAASERITITRPFYIGIYEVTQAQYMAVMPRNPSYWRNNPSWPVDQVDWQSVAGSNGFLARLNAKLDAQLGGALFADLPTEDDWEYAARAGTQSSFNNGRNIANIDTDSALDALANYNRAANGSPRPVGSFQPNAWGLFDMHGNIAEMCQNRSVRGGSWQSKAANCRITWRNQISTEAFGSNQNGFRLVLHVKESKDAGLK